MSRDLQILEIDLHLFGGRGASSSGGGGGSFTGELELPDGSKIEFEGTLSYDGDDKAVDGDIRKAIVSWEDKRRKNKIEYAYAVDANGNPIGAEVKGGKGSVRTPFAYHDTQDAVFTHIHPRGDGILGGTFSGADLRNFAGHRNKTCRAAAKEGTYSISKTKNFDQKGFLHYVRTVDADFNSKYRTKVNEVYRKYKSGNITYDQYKTENAKAFNTGLVELHNAYKSGQKQYGYTYTLEKI